MASSPQAGEESTGPAGVVEGIADIVASQTADGDDLDDDHRPDVQV